MSIIKNKRSTDGSKTKPHLMFIAKSVASPLGALPTFPPSSLLHSWLWVLWAQMACWPFSAFSPSWAQGMAFWLLSWASQSSWMLLPSALKASFSGSLSPWPF
uniref:Uncharacterized protein n=1 Tax=Anguilla anguilla TaxID=7936 RepID=A0A0E9X8W6_ANGAN